MNKVVWAGFLLCAISSLAHADLVFLKGGQKLEGEIHEKGSGFEIKNEYGAWTFTKDEVVKIVRSIEKITADGDALHQQARALYDEAVAIDNDTKAANAKLRSGLELLRKIVDLYNDALETYTEPRYAHLQKSVITLLQEMRLYRDKIHSEVAPVVVAPKVEPAAPVPVVRAPAKPAAIDPAILLPKAMAGDLEAQYTLGRYYDDQAWTSLEAQKWLRSAADKQHARAQDRLGWTYAVGKGVKQDYKQAQEWFQKAEKGGSSLARFHLGLLEWQGALAPRNLEKAYTWCDKADEGLWDLAYKLDPEAMMAISWMLMEGMGRAQDLKKAADVLQEATDLGSAPALTLLGIAYRDGKLGEKDPAKAEKALQKAAELGYAEAQVDLGELFDEYTDHKNDKGKDFSRAKQWYQKAAQQGHPRAVYRLGLIQLDGKGVAKNPTEAVTLFLQANLHATDDFWKYLLNDLGYVYERGQGVKRDVQEGQKYYRLAADQGSLEAQYNLGTISLEKNNEKDAYKWYLMAAKKGHAMAQNNLGTIYATGRTVKKNLDEAEKWFLMAAQRGDASAAENLKKLQMERTGK